MSTEAIAADICVREFTKELHNRNAAIFAGAGLSVGSGYVDWRALLHEIIRDLGLDPANEEDLVTVAQYHCNQAGGNRAHLTQTIFEHFAQTKTPTENHRLLASMPIQTYWTTNYDKLIESSLVEAKRVPDVKYTHRQLAVTRPGRDVIVYKMHGDIEHPADAVICRDDYERYSYKMSEFVSALRGDLIEKTFLFLGFSFTDPNINYILSRVRALYEQDARQHFSIQRKVVRAADDTDDTFKYRQLRQHYFIKDLKRFGIQTVLVDNFADITGLLQDIQSRVRCRSIFIAGSAHDFRPWDAAKAHAFIHDLAYTIAKDKCRIITGFGLGVGGAVINGSMTYLNAIGRTVRDDDLMMRPFPQAPTGSKALPELWADYRKEMIGQAGIAVFLFGNKLDATGAVVDASGMRAEFDLCVQAGVHPLPVGATGHVALKLWQDVDANVDKYFPKADATLRANLHALGDSAAPPADLIRTIQKLIGQLQRG